MSLGRNKRYKNLKQEQMNKSELDDVFGTEGHGKIDIKKDTKLKKFLKKWGFGALVIYTVFALFYTAISLISKLF